MTSYAEKLKDPRWQRKRLEILNRDEFTCLSCGDKQRTLHVHHGCYLRGRDPWDYPSELLFTLCESCHAETTQTLDEIQKFIGSLSSEDLYVFSSLVDSIRRVRGLPQLWEQIGERASIEYDLHFLLRQLSDDEKEAFGE